GPAGHHGKAGTPTMGGLVIFLSVLVPFLILSDYRQASLAVLATALVMAALGFADDIVKLRKRRSLGVSGKTKLVIQALTAIALWLAVTEYVGLNDTLRLRVVDASVELGLAYPVLIFLVLAGATNGVNLTDGLDGLAAGCAAIVLLTFTAMTFITQGQQDLALLSASLVGACVGFLWFNSFPASVFMGDTGSLGLGGAIAALAVITKTELLLIVIGGIFVIEALSVAIQVFAFQRFRRRVFLMAPIHHHFELAGWSETKIILRFWIVAAICAAIGFTLYQASIPS
ncbi:MAG TPA: phospho-N-acetylmuramoyl-pentapeptide-transferase, partial [Thermoleophilaceae bacterium]|nr:phospho-N-acetylmuramoyl-pentapeptide-transferase [Thermoleophilaceae bacterium]